MASPPVILCISYYSEYVETKVTARFREKFLVVLNFLLWKYIYNNNKNRHFNH